ncbi:hypothetical protein AMELA_G00118790, partial [Ameiurus melas]
LIHALWNRLLYSPPTYLEENTGFFSYSSKDVVEVTPIVMLCHISSLYRSGDQQWS